MKKKASKSKIVGMLKHLIGGADNLSLHKIGGDDLFYIHKKSDCLSLHLTQMPKSDQAEASLSRNGLCVAREYIENGITSTIHQMFNERQRVLVNERFNMPEEIML